MKKKIFLAFCCSMLLVVAFSTSALAADVLARFLGNDQHALVIGKVAEAKKDGNFVVYPSHAFVSANGINPGYEAPNLGKKITVQAFTYSYDDKLQGWLIPKVGDKVLLSLNEAGNAYAIAHGAYKLTDTVYERALVVAPKGTPLNLLADYYAMQLFIQSDGKQVVSGFDAENILLHDGTAISYIKAADKLSMQTITQQDMDYGKDDAEEQPSWFDNFVKKYGFAGVVLILGGSFLLGIWLSKKNRQI